MKCCLLLVAPLNREWWDDGYDTTSSTRRGSSAFVAPLHGVLPYAHRAAGPEWTGHGHLIAYVPPRRLVECCKLVLRDVVLHQNAHFREALHDAAILAYEKAFKTFFQPGTLLEAMDDMGIGRTVEEGKTHVTCNFTSAAFVAGLQTCMQRYNGLDWVGEALAHKKVSFEALWASDARLHRCGS